MPELIVLDVSDSTFEIPYINFIDNDKFLSQFKIYKLSEFDYNMYKVRLHEKASEHTDVCKTKACKLKYLQSSYAINGRS
jgi:hypothetical protein